MSAPLWLVAILVRSGLFIIADGALCWRWARSNQLHVIRSEQYAWWFSERLLPFEDEYLFTRERVTGDNRRNTASRRRHASWGTHTHTG